ncbi:MAG: sulfate ABC transporter substrate-binding protein [Oscillatoriaceae cyanobacterium]
MKQIWAALNKWLCVMVIGVTLALTITACTGENAKGNKAELTLVSYMVTKAAYEAIIPQFIAKWKQEHQQELIVNETYGPSWHQTRTVIDGLDADVVALALAIDIDQIEKAGLIAPGWEKEVPNNAIVSRSVVGLVAREGNPKNIKNWPDLAKDDVQVITPDPKTSGGARWNFLALWGAIAQTGGSEVDAVQYISKVFQNAPVLPPDARTATDTFFQTQQGDVLINYENEIILAGLNGRKVTYVIPQVNISIENAVAIIDKNVDKHGNREIAEAFVNYLFTPEAQRAFAKVGFRPVGCSPRICQPISPA